MSRCFVTSDWHLAHSNIIHFETARTRLWGNKSIEDHDRDILDRYTSIVGDKDTVYFLGDIGWTEYSLEKVRCLPGNKILVLGNHDRFDLTLYLSAFSRVKAYTVLGGCIATHIPLHPSSVSRWKGNIHGHTHGKGSPPGPYVSACVELWDFKPVLLEELLKCIPSSS